MSSQAAAQGSFPDELGSRLIVSLVNVLFSGVAAGRASNRFAVLRAERGT